MSLIAFTTDLTTSVLLGSGAGVIITPITSEEFLEGLNTPRFRGFYTARSSCVEGYFDYFKAFVSPEILSIVHVIPMVFTWTPDHDLVYFMEPCPGQDTNEATTFLKVERRPIEFKQQ